MPFIDDQTEQNVIREFARVTGVKPEEVSVEVVDKLEEQGIRLKSQAQFKDESRETDVYIKQLEKNKKFQIVGTLTITGRASKKIDIDQEYTGNPYSLPQALTKLLAVAKVKKGFFKSYLG